MVPITQTENPTRPASHGKQIQTPTQIGTTVKNYFLLMSNVNYRTINIRRVQCKNRQHKKFWFDDLFSPQRHNLCTAERKKQSDNT